MFFTRHQAHGFRIRMVFRRSTRAPPAVGPGRLVCIEALVFPGSLAEITLRVRGGWAFSVRSKRVREGDGTCWQASGCRGERSQSRCGYARGAKCCVCDAENFRGMIPTQYRLKDLVGLDTVHSPVLMAQCARTVPIFRRTAFGLLVVPSMGKLRQP